MNKIKLLLLTACLFGVFVSCKKNGAPEDGLFHFELKGGDTDTHTLIVPVNGTYSDPGVSLTYLGKAYDNVEVGGDQVDPKKVGMYIVTYTFTSPEGIKYHRTRDVFVCNPDTKIDISGQYLTMPGSKWERKGDVVDLVNNPIVIKKLAPGIFHISDFGGGVFAQYKAFVPGFIQVTDENKVIFLSSSNAYGETTPLTFEDYDPVKHVLSYQIMTFYGRKFTISLQQKNNE